MECGNEYGKGILYSGNFHVVQNFMVFTDRVATAKIKTTKISIGGENDDIIVNELKLLHTAQVNDRSSDCFSHV